MAVAYRPRPVFQLKRDPDHREASRLGGSNCNPSAAATLIDFATCGRKRTTGAAVRDLTGDTSGGTWLGDVIKAVRRGYRVDMDLNTGRFEGVLKALEAGRGVSLCGSSSATLGTEFQASETFNGNHQIALTDIRRRPDGTREILVFDPLADARRAKIARAPMWVPVPIIREFAGKLDLRSEQERLAGKPREPLGVGRATYAITEVADCTAEQGEEEPKARLRAGAKAVGGDDGRRLAVAVPVGRVRELPSTTSDIVGRKRDGDVFLAYQRVRGQQVDGSFLWYGDRVGSRWMHVSLFELSEAGELDQEQPGDDPETVDLPEGTEGHDADDRVLEGLEDIVDEPVWD